MAYEVTATRRRPGRFEEMIGQDFVVATLQKSIAAGKIAHAYLFSGPRGCGKTSSARILAKSLNCQEGPSATPCGKCAACVEIARGSSLDVIEIDGASNTSVNDVRQIKDEVQFPPNSCRYKVYIIDEVHMLSTSAFNALLKTIEEPPPYVVFIFATTEIHKVPATIKSRCQQFNFRLVPAELLKESLALAAGELSIQADEEALFWIAREATGSVRDAYTLFDQVAAFSDGHITYEKIRDKLGLVGVDRINPLVEACAARDSLSALEALDGIVQSGVSVEQFTVDLADYFRSLLLIRSGIVKESLLGQSPDRFSQRVLELWSPIQIERALSVMLQLFRDIRYSVDPRYELELAVSRISWISDYVSPVEMRQAIAQAQNALLKGGAGARRDSGPFPDAARAVGLSATAFAPSQVTDRVAASPAGGPTASQANEGVIPTGHGLASGSRAEPTAGDNPSRVVSNDAPPPAAGTVNGESADGADERIVDPFADFKRRIGAGNQNGAPPRAEGRSDPVEPVPSATVEQVTTRAEPPGNAIPFDELPAALVEALQSTKNMVATGIAQCFDWRDSGATVHFSVDKALVHNLLEQERKTIADAVSSLLGRACGVEIHMDSSRATGGGDGPEAIPAEVETVRKMFRGTII